MAELRAKKRARLRVPRSVWVGVTVAIALASGVAFAMRRGWNPREPFTRKAPMVEQAIATLNAKDYEAARQTLSAYLGTGACTDEGSLALSERVRLRADGSFDLGLALFQIAESYGGPFGEEDVPATDGKEPEIDPKRKASIECGRILALAIASDPDVSPELRARASYLAGNLEFLGKNYEESVKHYDRALELVPGISDKAPGDSIGRDAAWNRAIALRRIEEKKQRDEEKKKNEPPEDKKDQDQDKKDQPAKPEEPKPDPEALAEPPEAKAPPSSRMLEDLREVPTYQEENAKRDAARGRRSSTMEDK